MSNLSLYRVKKPWFGSVNFYEAFSLIELIITIIIIALLLASFTPLITKKIKASDVTVGSFSSNTVDDSINSQSDCDSISNDLLFIPKSATNTKNLCVMKYNVGDGRYGENWSGVQKCFVGGNCEVENSSSTSVTKDNLTPTCWLGTTAKASTCNSNYGNYSGCNRTVCNWTGGNKLCSNLGFRLPTIEELQSFASTTYSNNTLNENGLMFCDYSNSSTMAPICTYLANGCIGTYPNNCNPYHVWSSTFSTASIAYDRGLNGQWYNSTYYLGHGFSVRCVTDNTSINFEKDDNDNCSIKKGDSCLSCVSGFVLLNGKCLACEPSNGFVKVNNLCVMQYNIGDGKYFENWNGVQKCLTGNACNVINGNNASATKDNLTPTCWQGTTASTCNANYGNYSGCTRTICNWTGANQLCSNLGWRLPTSEELDNFANETYSNNVLASNGLMICDYSTSANVAPVCTSFGSQCAGAHANNCFPYHLWSSSFSGSSLALSRLKDNYWSDAYYDLCHAFSARCVKDL